MHQQDVKSIIVYSKYLQVKCIIFILYFIFLFVKQSITVALRGTASIVKRRRFLFTEKVQVSME